MPRFIQYYGSEYCVYFSKMNITGYLQQREMGLSTRNDFQAKDKLFAMLEEQVATPVTNQVQTM